MKHNLLLPVTAATLMFALLPAPVMAETCPTTAEASAEKPKKRKGLGFGGLLKAARDAGVGDMLGGGLLGNGAGAQVAGTVAGTALNAAADDGSESGGMGGGLMSGMMPGGFGGYGGSRASQIAGAVAGTAVELARSEAAAKPCQPAN